MAGCDPNRLDPGPLPPTLSPLVPRRARRERGHQPQFVAGTLNRTPHRCAIVMRAEASRVEVPGRSGLNFATMRPGRGALREQIPFEKGLIMPVIKVIELIAQSEKSWEDAAQVALSEASKTIRDIKNIYIQEMQAVVENGKIVRYRIDAKVSFLVSDAQREGPQPKKK